MPIADVSAYASDMSTCVMGRCGEMWGDVGRDMPTCAWGEMGRCAERWGDMPRRVHLRQDVPAPFFQSIHS